MIIMTYGDDIGAHGELRINEEYFLRNCSGKFVKMLKTARRSDRETGSDTVHQWEAAALRLRQAVKEAAAAELKVYNSDCEALRRKYDDPAKPHEKKREALKEMDKHLKARKKWFDTRLRVLEREYKRFGRLAETARRFAS